MAADVQSTKMADPSQSQVPNPRARKPGDRRLTPRPPAGSAMWYVLGFILLAAIGQAVLASLQSGDTVSYSEFKNLVRQHQVQEVTVGEERVRAVLTKPDGNGKSRAVTAVRIDDPKLVEDLEANGVKYSGELASKWVGEVLGWVIPLIFLVGLWSFFFRRMGGAEGGVMSFARSRAKIYADDDVKVRFVDVAGVDEAEEELREIVEFLKNPRKYTSIGGRIPKGVLLVGPPGTGKTLLARAVAGEAKVPFFSLSGSEFVEMFVGVGAARVRDLFAQAEQKAPCIVFIDELDALGKVRIQTPMGSHEEREQTLNQLLAEMDGFDARKGVIIMAATNRPEVLDPALLRPGRFDRQVLVDKPDVRGREEILRIHVRNVRIGPNVDLKVIAARTAGFAGADLANLVNEAALLAARRDKTAVEMKDFDEAIDRVIAGLEKKRVMSDKERRIVAYHESGHAIVASVLPGLDPVHKISIVQRGFGALGYTMQLPLEDRYLMTRQDLQSQLSVLLGGRSAEEIAFKEISTGAQNDLQRATDIARAMVTEFGMSDALGAVNYNGHKRSAFLELPFVSERGNYAEETALMIDAEVKRILTEAHETARRVILEHRQILDDLSHRLLEKEVIEADELKVIMGLPAADQAPVPVAPAATRSEG
jgi:cell division protease FtsH